MLVMLIILVFVLSYFLFYYNSSETFVPIQNKSVGKMDILKILENNKCSNILFNKIVIPTETVYYTYPYTEIDNKYSDIVKIINKIINSWYNWRGVYIERIYCFCTIRSEVEQLTKVLLTIYNNRQCYHLLLLFHCKIGDIDHIFDDNGVKYTINLTEYENVTTNIDLITYKINEKIRTQKLF